ncbi:MAG: hypothetical protein AOA65_0821 [Candidatus Bathyarchaeota archaeon BA1]|nr:MAG: hypothetical protein AOA65_0821 [Candidatus Bathyarchaeota archaeon BA1]
MDSSVSEGMRGLCNNERVIMPEVSVWASRLPIQTFHVGFFLQRYLRRKRRILEYMAKECYYPLSGESENQSRKKPMVTVQVATETPYTIR